MSQYTEKIDKLTLPVVPLGDAVAFPPFPIDFESDSKEAAAAVEAAAGAGMMVFLVSEDSELAENEFPDNLCRVGTVAKIRQSVNNDGSINNRDLSLLQQYLNEWDVELFNPYKNFDGTITDETATP